MSETMTSRQTLATGKAVKKAALTEARNGVEVGDHDVDFWLHIYGSFKVGDDYTSAPTVAIPYKKAFAALVHVSGCTGKAGLDMIRKAMEIALADESEGTAKDALQDICPKVERIEQEIIDPMLKSLPKIPCKGKVTTKLKMEIR